jgi:hypothetical protein
LLCTPFPFVLPCFLPCFLWPLGVYKEAFNILLANVFHFFLLNIMKGPNLLFLLRPPFFFWLAEFIHQPKGIWTLTMTTTAYVWGMEVQFSPKAIVYFSRGLELPLTLNTCPVFNLSKCVWYCQMHSFFFSSMIQNLYFLLNMSDF